MQGLFLDRESSLCVLRVLCVSVVSIAPGESTTETQRDTEVAQR